MKGGRISLIPDREENMVSLFASTHLMSEEFLACRETSGIPLNSRDEPFLTSDLCKLAAYVVIHWLISL